MGLIFWDRALDGTQSTTIVNQKQISHEHSQFFLRLGDVRFLFLFESNHTVVFIHTKNFCFTPNYNQSL